MNALYQFIGGLYFRLVVSDNARWFLLVGFIGLMLLIGLTLLPYALTPPLTNYGRAERELYEFAAAVRGEAPLIPAWAGDGLAGLWRWLGWTVFGLAGLGAVVSAATFLPTFWDDARRATERMRINLWTRYGGEIHRSGFFSRLLLGRTPPAGASPPATPPAGGEALTKPAFLFWEALIDFGTQFIFHQFRERRRP